MELVVKSSARGRRSSTARTARNPEATKTQILDAAEEEFARYGLAGARTEPIAANTGVTKAMIHYYFGTKEELYQAVLKRQAALFHSAVEQIDVSDLSPEAALKKFLRLAVDYENTQPYHGKVLLHEAMTNEGKYFKLTGWEVPFGLGAAVLQRGVDEGCFRPLDAANNLKQLEPLSDWQSPEAIENYADSAIAFILAGVLKHPEASS